MIPIGQTYQPSGAFEPFSAITALMTGLVGAALCGLVILIWEISPIPSLLILTSLAQGLGVGAVLIFLFRKARLRNPVLGAIIAVVCAAASVMLVHYGHYRHQVGVAARMIRDEVESSKDIPEERRAEVLRQIEQDPAGAVDEFIFEPETGRRGFVGFMMLRNQLGEQIKRSTISGTALWIMWAVEGLFVIGAAVVLGWKQAKAPFCEDCGRWFSKIETKLWAPPGEVARVTEAVTSDDAARVAALHPIAEFDPAGGSASIEIEACPDCVQTLASVVHRTPGKKQGEFAEQRPARRVRVSPEMLEAMTPVPAPAAAPTDALPEVAHQQGTDSTATA